MQAVKRLKQFGDEPLDILLSKMIRGEIKPGRYSYLVKIDKSKDYSKEKELFQNE